MGCGASVCNALAESERFNSKSQSKVSSEIVTYADMELAGGLMIQVSKEEEYKWEEEKKYQPPIHTSRFPQIIDLPDCELIVKEKADEESKYQCQYPGCTHQHDFEDPYPYQANHGRCCRMPGCRKTISIESIFCEAHRCTQCRYWGGWIDVSKDIKMCPTCWGFEQMQPVKFCLYHICRFHGCYNIREHHEDYCKIHLCKVEGCHQNSLGRTYCPDHKCYFRGCQNHNQGKKFCHIHRCSVRNCHQTKWKDNLCLVHSS